MSIPNPWQDSTDDDSAISLARLSLADRIGKGNLIPWIAGAAIFILLLTAYGVGSAVSNSIRGTMRNSVESSVEAKAQSIRLWLSQHRENVVAFALDDEIKQHSLALIDDFSALQASESSSQKQVHARLAGSKLQQLDSKLYDGWILLDDQGRVVASSQEKMRGQVVSVPRNTQAHIDRLEAAVSVPFWCFADSQPGQVEKREATQDAPVMIAAAPIRNGARPVGCLALIMDPASHFSDLVTNAPAGSSQCTYAFNRKALMITRTKNEEELRSLGVLDENSSSVLKVPLRDVASVGGKLDPDEVTTAPLTWMADRATRGASGSNFVGYNDFRGRKVVGSWQWISEYDFGIATEIDYAEAYAPMRILRYCFLIILTAFAMIAAIAYAVLKSRNWLLDHANVKEGSARRLGQYELGEVIGRGGMGKVYRGRHGLLQRDVAIKVLEGSEVTRHSLKRFEREVRMTAQLRHPNTIDIYDYGRTSDATFYYVMEYIEGISLLELVKEYGRQPPERVIYLLLQICGSLSEAHNKSMIHRDIKPGNILITCHAGLYDMVKVLDFGLVKNEANDTVEMTQVSSITGTPLYMSPEAVRDASTVDRRSDIYSVGAVGYHLLCGMSLFDGETAADVCAKQLHETPIRPSDRLGVEMPEDLQNVLMACLQKEPDQRPPTAQDLAQVLMHCVHANAWTTADACQWWEEIFAGTRDGSREMVDNRESTKIEGSDSPYLESELS